MADTTTHYAIVRHAKQRTLSDVHVAACHNDRTLPSKHTKPGQDTTPKTLLGVTGHKAVTALLREKISKLRKQPKSNTVRAVEVILTASPGWFKPNGKGGWDAAKVAQFEQAVVDFARAEYGENLLQVVMHYDETSPHAHVLCMPVLEGRLCCKQYTARTRLRQVVTRWAEATKHLGLVRGVHRDGVTHTELKDFYAAVKAPLPKMRPRPKEPEPTIKQRFTGVGAELVEAYERELAAWESDARAYRKALEAKARAVDIVAPDLKERERKLALDRIAVDEQRHKYDDLVMQLQARADLDARTRIHVIKAIPRPFLEGVLGVALPGKRDPVDVLRDMGVVKNLQEGVDYIYAALARYGSALDGGGNAVSTEVAAAPSIGATLATEALSTVPSLG